MYISPLSSAARSFSSGGGLSGGSSSSAVAAASTVRPERRRLRRCRDDLLLAGEAGRAVPSGIWAASAPSTTEIGADSSSELALPLPFRSAVPAVPRSSCSSSARARARLSRRFASADSAAAWAAASKLLNKSTRIDLSSKLR